MSLEFLLSYAGVQFLPDVARVVRMKHQHAETDPPEELTAPRKHQPEADIIEELGRLMNWRYLQDFTVGTWQGRNLSSLIGKSNPDPQPDPEININDYYYPYDACRWLPPRKQQRCSLLHREIRPPLLCRPIHCCPVLPRPLRPTPYRHSFSCYPRDRWRNWAGSLMGYS